MPLFDFAEKKSHQDRRLFPDPATGPVVNLVVKKWKQRAERPQEGAAG